LIIEERRNAWTRSTENASKIVAVCDWVRETIIKNDVPSDKVMFSRHGLRLGSTSQNGTRTGNARFGYLGRISPEKGIDLLLDVLRELPPELDFEFEFCSSSFKSELRPEELRLVDAIRALAESDRRLKILDDIRDEDLRAVLANWDAMVVPSRWLESGPQVIYESFAVQTPIIGSRLGGIAELVSDGQTGFLFEPGQRPPLQQLLIDCANNPSRLRELRPNIGTVRTTQAVADDMLTLYTSLLESKDLRHQRAG
jgi:glycosyltransferase involved in cell wall biosynthesis